MDLDRDLRRIAEAAGVFAAGGEEVTGIVPTEPASGVRLYVCAYADQKAKSWLVLDATGVPVEERSLVHEAVSIAALCELAEDAEGVDPKEPRVATPALLDALGASGGAEVAAAVAEAAETVSELVRDVERGYKRSLS